MRYLSLYLHFVRFSFSKALLFRANFVLHALMDIGWYATQIVFYTTLFNYTEILGGWTYAQVMIFVGSVFLVDAIEMAVFDNNIWWLPIFINRGDLDYYLVRPVSSLYFLLLRDFSASTITNVFMAGGFLAWAISQYPGDISAAGYLAYACALLCGVLIFSFMKALFVITAFWTGSDKGLRAIFGSLQRFGTQPHRIYKGWLSYVLSSVLPFAFVASWPTTALFEADPWRVALSSIVIASALLLLLAWVWRMGLRRYSSASS